MTTTTPPAFFSVDDMRLGEILMSLKRGTGPDHIVPVAKDARDRPQLPTVAVTVSQPSSPCAVSQASSYNLIDIFNLETLSVWSPMAPTPRGFPAVVSPSNTIFTLLPKGGSKRYGPVVQLEDLRGCFNMPIAAVAHKFGICVTLLKKICRRHGIQRWPHRQIRSLQKSLDMLRESLHAAKGTNKEYITKKIVAFEYTLECIMQDPNTAAKGISAGRLASPATEELIKRGHRAKSRKIKARAALSDDEEGVTNPAGGASSAVMMATPDWTSPSGARRLSVRRASLPMSLQSILC